MTFPARLYVLLGEASFIFFQLSLVPGWGRRSLCSEPAKWPKKKMVNDFTTKPRETVEGSH